MLKLAGSKLFINHKGIFFKEGKNDKFLYLPFLIMIIESINHPYEKDVKYSFNLDKKLLDSHSLETKIKNLIPNIEEILNKNINIYQKNLHDKRSEINEDKTLLEIEKEIWIKNLDLMEDYEIQRAKNKIVYFLLVDLIITKIKKEKIKKIELPFNMEFCHVLKSIKNELSKNKILSKVEEKDLELILNINI